MVAYCWEHEYNRCPLLHFVMIITMNHVRSLLVFIVCTCLTPCAIVMVGAVGLQS